MNETKRLSFKLLARDKEALRRLASAKGEAMSVIVRGLIRKEIQRYGLSIVEEGPGEQPQQVNE